jgi:hypothetical protein
LRRHDDPKRRLLAPRKPEPKPGGRQRPHLQRRLWLAAAALGVLFAAIFAVWVVRSRGPVPVAAPKAGAASQAIAASAPAALTTAIPLAGVDELLLAPKALNWRARRLRDNPSILVIEFPGLDEQGMAMNRLAAMYEKRNGDRDRVMADAELNQLLRANGDSVASFFQGHDYTGEMLARFFSLASRQQVPLKHQEMALRVLLVDAKVLRPEQAGTFSAVGIQAVVSFTAAQEDDPLTKADESVDAWRRESVLRHELSHGEFFTNADYRAYCWDFWRHTLSERERKLVRQYLAGLDYNPGDEELMVNEMQATLMHTPDDRAFSAAALGVSTADMNRLRAQFRRGDPVSRASAAPAR